MVSRKDLSIRERRKPPVIDPRNTSRTCPPCGHCAKENRRTQSLFPCVQCGFQLLNETSLVMALCPSLVDLSRLSPDRAVWPQGVGGQDPRDATPAHGEACIAASLDLLEAKLAALGFGPPG